MLKKQLILPAIAVALLAGVYYLSSSGQLPDVKKIVTENKDYLQKEAGVLGEMRHFFPAGVRVVKETCSIVKAIEHKKQYMQSLCRQTIFVLD